MAPATKMGRFFFFFFFFFLFFFFFFHLVSSELPANQTAAMDKLYEILKNNTPQSSFPWGLTKHPNPCSWKGVGCSGDNSSITNISLPLFSISALDFLVVLCQIDTLEVIDLSINHFSSIPDRFMAGCGRITGLKRLNFSTNKLSGPLPAFRDFSALEYLDLSHNSLSGAIGLQLDGLSSLKSLKIAYNQFSGSVPIHLGKSMALQDLELSANNFEGKIPEELANYSNLSVVDLGTNRLSGSIPDRFRELSKLETLVLSSNKFSGGIPQFLSSVRTLSRFAAHQNHFAGVIPPGITKYLSNLDLSYNKLKGSIPEDLLSQSNLRALDLSYNSLEGSIPAKMSPSLVRLRLGNNLLSGKIPSSPFQTLQNLTYLELESNSLNGSIPSELGFCKNLALLNLAENKLTGVLPIELGNLQNLKELKLQLNNLAGEIPDQLTRLQGLQKLNISWNSFSGSIPLSISRLQNLINLDLRENNLSGSIPNSIQQLNSLIELQLGKNTLNGTIGGMPQNLQIALNLSHNLFEGPIPETLSKLSVLEVLDLSNNRFSGNIPAFLVGMGSLTEVELSNNQLTGEIPKFPARVNVIVRGNKGLRNTTKSNYPTASQKKRNKVLIGVGVAVAAAVLAVGIAVMIAVSISNRQDSSQPQVMQGNLLTANGIHRSNIDFTKGIEAVTLPSNIILKTKFSTYYEAVMPSGMSYFVKKLNWINWSDKTFQLGNREKFEEGIKAIGKLSNSNVMTPLAYVLTVDSAYLFYEFAHKGTLFDVLHGSLGEALDWASRYSIAIGVTQGLAFLHGCTSSPVLLLDLSSRSILLKSLKEPQLGDIELCKVINPMNSTSRFSAVAGSVGYIPPEYAYTMRVTMAGNVYSFGVVLLELLTGKPAVSHGIELAKWVLANSADGEKPDKVLDSSVKRTSQAARNQMLAVLKVALACVSTSPDARPKAKSILRMLLNAR